MDGQSPGIQAEAVLLRDDSVGVVTETKPRKVQVDGSFYTTLNSDWLAQLNLGDQGAPTLHSLSLGIRPVIVQNPAIIVQPQSVLDQEGL